MFTMGIFFLERGECQEPTWKDQPRPRADPTGQPFPPHAQEQDLAVGQHGFGIPFWLVGEFTVDVYWGYGALTHSHLKPFFVALVVVGFLFPVPDTQIRIPSECGA